ncbi:MAG: methylthioribulose 1-phosphate dehydratase [Planctomycetota bacterium]
MSTTVDTAPPTPAATSADESAKGAATGAALQAAIGELRATGADFHRRGWSLGTSSNYSVVVQRDPLELLITVSGKDKGRLTADDFVRIGADGIAVDGSDRRASAEALLHAAAAEQLPAVGAVLHTHSVAATVLTRRAGGCVTLEGYEMLKGLAGNATHEMAEHVRVFDNTQDIASLAGEVRAWLRAPGSWKPDAGPQHSSAAATPHGFLLRGHGLYTWGATLADARRHVEVIEFLLECELHAAGVARAD